MIHNLMIIAIIIGVGFICYKMGYAQCKKDNMITMTIKDSGMIIAEKFCDWNENEEKLFKALENTIKDK